MSPRLLLVVASASLMLVCPGPARSSAVASSVEQASPAPKPASQIQGRWEVATINGTAPSSMVGGEMLLVFTGEKYQQLIQGAVTEEGAITIDASKTPHHIDLSIKTGDDAGKVQLGLFVVKGDEMSLTLGLPADATEGFEVWRASPHDRCVERTHTVPGRRP